tara:strand:+ start:977 stop:1204 length:228 start_codon:yes stop_codon:yes gene_type:complete
MRKRDKIKGYLPYVAGGMYFLLLKWLIGAININAEEYIIYLVALWGFITAWSVVVLEEVIDLFDISMDNGKEEEE